MTIGIDIKSVLEEIGLNYSIIRDSGDISEYTMVKANSQVTKPFIREFFLEGYISYDTQAEVGDILKFETEGAYFLLMHKTPELLENEVYRYAVVYYRCNQVVDVLRPLDREPDDRYRVSITWTHVARQTRCCITTPLYGSELADEPIGEVKREVYEMYAPTSLGIRPQDRISISPTRYYKVETVKPFRYAGVDVVELHEDTRGLTVTTTTSTTTTTTTTA